MFKSCSRSLCVGLFLGLMLSACSSPTPVPMTTIAPTLDSTLTPLPPTATAVPSATPNPSTATSLPTATLVPPTNTPLPTATPIPPTITSVPKATPTRLATKAASLQSLPAVVSAQPSNVVKSIQQAFNAAQALTGQLNALFQGDVALCAPMLQSLDSLVNAPSYDVNTEPANVQQAYGLYRGAIDQLNDQVTVLKTCGASGKGTINPNELGTVHPKVGQAANQLAQAWSLVQNEASVSSAGPTAPLLTAIRQVMYDADTLGEFRSRVSAGKVDNENPYFRPPFPFPMKVTSFPCDDFTTIYNRLTHAPTFDVSAQSAAIQAAYDKYLKALTLIVDNARPVFGTCAAQTGVIGTGMIFDVLYGAQTAHGLFSQAIQLLTQ